MYNDEDAPRYVLAMVVNAAFALASIFGSIAMRFILLRANKKLERNQRIDPHMEEELVEELPEERFLELKGFKYIA